MFKRILILVTLMALGPSSMLLSESKITVFTKLDADLYVNGAKQAWVNAIDPFKLHFKEPGTYKIELKARDQELSHLEEVTVVSDTMLEKTIRAFDNAVPAADKSSAAAAAASDGISKAELQAEVARAKSEVLAEEAARRKRQQEREISKKAVIHVIGVETQRMPRSVKNLERFKLLGDLIPILKDKKLNF